MIEVVCKNCGKSFIRFNTLQNLCAVCSYNKYFKGKQKSIKKVGKVTKKWIDYRQEWIKKHPPDYRGYYICGICSGHVHIDEVTLDHIEPRSNRQDLRLEDSNIQPAHYTCNSQKGSKH